MNGVERFVVAAGVVLACAAGAGAVDIETVSVANLGNDGEWSGESYGGLGPDRICGAVDHAYNIGTFEVTAGQYTEFLNAVAATDPYGLYHTNMWDGFYSCMIRRTGSSGSYAYLVDADEDDVEDADWTDRPVNYVSWGDAARFCNWLHNGQPTGIQDLTTTEDGSYYLNRATTDAELMAVVRKPDATWVIPSEDEWYKAAYHLNDGATGNYFDYPTSNDTVPSNYLIDPDPGNSANFRNPAYTIGSPYYRTVGGDFENSESPYDTFDQGGNVREWNETVVYGSYRGARGGAFSIPYYYLLAAYRVNYHSPTNEDYEVGFRVAVVPEPGYDMADFAAFQRCFGPEPDAMCRIAFDCNNADGDIDLDDYAAFYARFTGQSAPPCGMVLVPGGEFEMGDHHDGIDSALPVHAVHVDSFHMDVYEATNHQYAEALNWAWGQGDLISVIDGVVYDGGGTVVYCKTTLNSANSRITWDGSAFGVTAGKEDHPMVQVSWYGAAAYANWRSSQEGRTPSYDVTTWACDFGGDGYRLPTEAEWEYAARGGEYDPYYRYPWGDTADGSMANYSGSGDPFEAGPYPRTTPVGYYDGNQTPAGADMANGYGLYDMAGNVMERVNDWFGYSYYDSSPYDNPQGPANGTARMLRGGFWHSNESRLRCAHRTNDYPAVSSFTHGFRLVLTSD